MGTEDCGIENIMKLIKTNKKLQELKLKCKRKLKNDKLFKKSVEKLPKLILDLE